MDESPLSKSAPIGLRILFSAAAALLAGVLYFSGALRTFEYRLYDLLASMVSVRQPVSDDIVLLAIDDGSLVRMAPAVGRWPWPRMVTGAVVDYCGQAHTIAMDVLFPEGDQANPESDVMFADECARHAGVISAVFLDDDPNKPDRTLPADVYAMERIPTSIESPVLHRFLLTPFEELLMASAGVGHVNYAAESDGVVRRYLAVAQAGELLIPSLALAVAAHYREKDPFIFLHEQMQQGTLTKSLDVDAAGQFFWSPSRQRHRTMPIADVLESWQVEQAGGQPAIPRSFFEDKIVVIGSFATGLQMDRKVSPIESNTPGVAIIASAIDNLLHARSHRVAGSVVTTVFILLMAFLPAWLHIEQPKRMVLLGLIDFVVYLSIVGLAAWFFNIMLPVISPLVAMGVACTIMGVWYWGREREQRHRLEELELVKQQFTDMLVHDMKNSFGPVVMSTEYLQGKLESENPRIKKMISVARTTSKRVFVQLNTLLDLRKLQEGRMTVEALPMDIRDVICSVANEYEPAADLLNLKIETVFDEDTSFPAQIDAELFGRVLGNLLWNAIQYATPKTTIIMGANRLADGRVETFVANRGKVIPEDEAEMVFKPYVTKNDKQSGISGSASAGLGLAFCKLAVEAHAGRIRVESPWSDENDGVKVLVDLPALQA